jgi:hypothetical protein
MGVYWSFTASENTSRKAIGAIRIEGGHDIVIEGCDISDWGLLNPETGFGFDYGGGRRQGRRTKILSHFSSSESFGSVATGT